MKIALILLLLTIFMLAGGIYVILFCIGLVLVILKYTVEYTLYFFMFLYFAIEERIPKNKRKKLARQAKEKRLERRAQQEERLGRLKKKD
ncbi:hypothetical protein FW759_02320 [Psychrobacter sp. 1176_08]|uniref:hypothetical protein n=1 Tax=Psychrobacter sp. 1176_08 TaxID=2604452 RepID=UPI004063FAB9